LILDATSLTTSGDESTDVVEAGLEELSVLRLLGEEGLDLSVLTSLLNGDSLVEGIESRL
jgi:hypothetical protein